MRGSSSAEMGPPTFEDFEAVKEAVLEVCHLPDARVREPNSNRRFVSIERLYADTDFLSWPLLTVCFSGFLTQFENGGRMVLRYRELPHHQKTENSSVNHDYIIEARGDEVVEYGHSMRACPELPGPRQELITATSRTLDEVQNGTTILRQNTGGQLELSSGDCGVLFDRLARLIA